MLVSVSLVNVSGSGPSTFPQCFFLGGLSVQGSGFWFQVFIQVLGFGVEVVSCRFEVRFWGFGSGGFRMVPDVPGGSGVRAAHIKWLGGLPHPGARSCS